MQVAVHDQVELAVTAFLFLDFFSNRASSQLGVEVLNDQERCNARSQQGDAEYRGKMNVKAQGETYGAGGVMIPIGIIVVSDKDVKLLQLSRMELAELIREELNENPVLEDMQDGDDSGSASGAAYLFEYCASEHPSSETIRAGWPPGILTRDREMP